MTTTTGITRIAAADDAAATSHAADLATTPVSELDATGEETVDTGTAPVLEPVGEQVKPMASYFVQDQERFFRTSNLTNQLRDTAKMFTNKGGVTAGTVAMMAKEYNRLREQVKNCVTGPLAEATETETVAIAEKDDALTVDLVFYSAAQLARWVDSIETTPGYLLNMEVFKLNCNEVQAKAHLQAGAMAQMLSQKTTTDGEVTISEKGTNRAPGAYL